MSDHVFNSIKYEKDFDIGNLTLGSERLVALSESVVNCEYVEDDKRRFHLSEILNEEIKAFHACIERLVEEGLQSNKTGR